MNTDCVFTIFGATGHLARTKLLPALHSLHLAGHLPDGIAILCIGRRDYDTGSWRNEIASWLRGKTAVALNDEALSGFLTRVHYLQCDINLPESYRLLKDFLENTPGFSRNRIFYLSLPPTSYQNVAQQLANQHLHLEDNGWCRLIVEKPFGHDLEDAEDLDRSLGRHFSEQQIYRIDHYLGKETVQNVFVFRFANILLEPVWNRHYIDHIQITHSEQDGIDTRAQFYDQTGAMRDMIQSHLLQLMALVTMEPPASLDAESIRDEKVKVLKSVRPIGKHQVHAHAFRAQYASGMVENQRVCSYHEENGVPPDSTTETFAAIKLFIDNWRWRNVPVYLRTGKRMAEKRSMISIRFKHPPQQLFHATLVKPLPANWLLLGIQPEQAIRCELQIRESGIGMHTSTTQLDASTCENCQHHEAYEGLLLDAIAGDHTQYLRSDEVHQAWRIVDPIQKVWANERSFIHSYPSGSWGPAEASRIFDRDDQTWRVSLDFASATMDR